jgi:hypothetical protein
MTRPLPRRDNNPLTLLISGRENWLVIKVVSAEQTWSKYFAYSTIGLRYRGTLEDNVSGLTILP